MVLASGCAAAGSGREGHVIPFVDDAAASTPLSDAPEAEPAAAPLPPYANITIDCGSPDDDLPAARGEVPQTFWSDEPELRDMLGKALPRWSRATGLPLSVAPDGIMVVYTDLPTGMGGFASDHIDVDPTEFEPQWFETMLIHEVGHMLGSRHLGPYEGVMSRCLGMGETAITEADLDQVCAAAPCTTFVPETHSK